MKNLTFLTLMLASNVGFTQNRCADVLGPATSTKAREAAWLERMSQPLKEGEVGPRMVTRENTEVPDPAKPLPIRLPDGRLMYGVGVSGGHLILVKNLEDLERGGLKTPADMHFVNSQGHHYGKEIDPRTGEPIPYAWSSAVWDGAFAYTYRTLPGGERALIMKVFAGGMADNPLTGKPFIMTEGRNNTRQRLFFEAEFRAVPAGSANYVLTGFDPSSPLNAELPDHDEWVKVRDERAVFNHGYGGGPVTLLNGDLYLDEQGRVPFIYEAVLNQTETPDAHHPGRTLKKPDRTVIFVVYMDESLTHVLTEPKILLDIMKPDGTPYAAAERNSGGFGPLGEGGHLSVLDGRRPVASRAELQSLRAQGRAPNFELYFSMGEYYAAYGSFKAAGRAIDSLRIVMDQRGEPLDITAPLRVLFTWLGRPAPYYTGILGANAQVVYGTDGRKNLLVHGVARAWLPAGMVLDKHPEGPEWPHFSRQVITIPIEEYEEDGVIKERIRDNTGLIHELEQLKPRGVSLREQVLDILGGQASHQV